MENKELGPDPALVPSGPEALRASVLSDNDPGQWPEIEWDGGYPVPDDAPFAAFDDLPLSFNHAAAFLMRELPATAANCCASCEVSDGIDDFDKPVKIIEFSTGGWSGAESVIGLIYRRFDLKYFMLSWHRGGHYVFEVPLRFLSASPPNPKDQTG